MEPDPVTTDAAHHDPETPPDRGMAASLHGGCAAVFALALILRLVFATIYGGHGLTAKFSGNREDPQVYDWCARNILDVGIVGFRGEPSARRGPAYPLFLAAVYATIGDHPLRVRVVQAVLDAIAAVLVVLAVCSFAARRAALISGLLYACYPIYIFNASEIMTEGLALVLLSAAVATTLPAWRKASVGWATASGVCCGLAALTRENLAPVAVLWAVALVFCRATPWKIDPKRVLTRRIRIGLGAALMMGFLLAYGPWVVRNTMVLGTFMPAGSSGGENLLRSAGLAREGAAFNWRACLESNGLLNYWAYHNPAHRGEVFPNEVDSDRRAAALAWRWIRENPGRFLAYGMEKIGRLLVQVEERSGLSGPVLREGLAWSYRLVAMLGVIGGIVVWRRGERFAVTILAMLAFVGWAVIFVVVAWKRYRYVTFDLPCAMLAGPALDAMIRRLVRPAHRAKPSPDGTGRG